MTPRSQGHVQTSALRGRLLTFEELAIVLGATEKALAYLLDSGVLPYVRTREGPRFELNVGLVRPDLVAALLDLVESGPFDGGPEELLLALDAGYFRRGSWPRDARWMRRYLLRNSRGLRGAGVIVVPPPRGERRFRIEGRAEGIQ